MSSSVTYSYKISFYNTQYDVESLPSKVVGQLLSGSNSSIMIEFTSQIYDDTYDSWKVYRNTPTISGSENTFFHIATVMKTRNIYQDILSDVSINIQTNEYADPYFYLPRPINTNLINKPTTSLILESFYNPVTGNPFWVGATIDPGIYTYKVSFYNYNTGEETPTGPSEIIEIVALPSVNKFKVKVKIPISNDPRVTSRKIYRTNRNQGNYYLLVEVRDNTTIEYIDNSNVLIYQRFFDIVRPLVKPRLIDYGPGGSAAGTYKYKIT